MKIVCDSCQAKYSIADEKIQGKAFKIRCKKCNHIIVVKTAAEPSPAPEVEKPKSMESADQAIWHVVVDGEQVGPLAVGEVKDRLHQGQISADTLVWKDGLADWVGLTTIPELASLIKAPTAKSSARHSSSSIAVAQSGAAGRQSKSMPVAAPADEPEGDVFAAPTVVTTSSTADLFATPVAAADSQPSGGVFSASGGGGGSLSQQSAAGAASPFTFGGSAMQQPAEPAVVIKNPGNNSNMTGQRNENSVLFSLSNLEALAVPSQAKPPSTTSTSEGSGLIDIRSMAAMTLSTGSSPESRSSSDALPTFSTPQFNPVAPVLLPTAHSGAPKWVIPVGVILGVAACAMLYLIWKAFPSAPPPPPPPQIIIQQQPAPVQVQPVAQPSPTPTAEQPKEVVPTEQPSPSDKEKGSEKSGKGSGSKADHSKRKGKDTEAKPGDAKKTADSTPTAPSAPGRKGSADDIFGDMKKAEAPKPVERLVSLSKSDIVSAMTGIQPKIQACANQFKVPGTAMATISVAKGGKVGKAEVTGKFAGSPTGACVESAAKSAKFPACEPMSFPFPFTLAPR